MLTFNVRRIGLNSLKEYIVAAFNVFHAHEICKIYQIGKSKGALNNTNSFDADTIEKCEKLNWDKNIPNKELVKKIYNIYKNTDNLKLQHIKAHTNKKDIHSIGNATADKLAYNAIKNYKRALNKNS